MTAFIYIFLLLLFVSALSIMYWSLKNGISPMPTSAKVKSKLLAIPLRLPSGVIYELGAGWGTLAFALATKFPSHQVIAYETSLIPYLYCLIRHLLQPHKNLYFERRDFFHHSFQDAALVVCYLYPEAMTKLKKKFIAELPPMSLILTHTFGIRGWKPRNIYPVEDLYKTEIYLYDQSMKETPHDH